MTTMAILLKEMTDPGDRCLIYSPVYDSFATTVNGVGRTLVSLSLKETDGSYTLPLAETEDAFRQGVRCLLFCNPHNPCGRVWREDELSALVGLCRKYDILILSDDVHGDWCYAPTVICL